MRDILSQDAGAVSRSDTIKTTGLRQETNTGNLSRAAEYYNILNGFTL